MRNAGFRPAREGSLEDGACREPGRLDPAGRHDEVAGEAMPVIEVQGERDVLAPVSKQVGDGRSRDRIVDPAWEFQVRRRRRRPGDRPGRTGGRASRRWGKGEFGTIVVPSSESGSMESRHPPADGAERPR